MILVTFAVPFESAAFRRLPISRTVRILHTGVGAEAARAAMETAICEELPARVIAAGFAGSLLPELRVGAIATDSAWRFVSASEVLASREAKRAFRASTGADVVDMETAAIRDVCVVAGIAVTALRAISDGPEDDLGLPPEFLEKLSRQPLRAMPRLIGTLLADGVRRKAFLRLVKDCRKAQLALAAGLAQELTSPYERASKPSGVEDEG